jgi:hypothetical protein
VYSAECSGGVELSVEGIQAVPIELVQNHVLGHGDLPMGIPHRYGVTVRVEAE